MCSLDARLVIRLVLVLYCFSICYWLPGAYLINYHSQHYKKIHYVTVKQCLDFIEGFDELSMTVSLCLKKNVVSLRFMFKKYLFYILKMKKQWYNILRFAINFVEHVCLKASDGLKHPNALLAGEYFWHSTVTYTCRVLAPSCIQLEMFSRVECATMSQLWVISEKRINLWHLQNSLKISTQSVTPLNRLRFHSFVQITRLPLGLIFLICYGWYHRSLYFPLLITHLSSHKSPFIKPKKLIKSLQP